MSLRTTLARLSRKALILPPILVGAAVLAAVVARRNVPEKQVVPEAARPLRFIEVVEAVVVPRVLGYGTARPADTWSAVAEVKGRIVETHAELKAGAIIGRGETVVRIDPTEYELKIAQLQAEIAQTKAQQAELDAQETNYRNALEIEEESVRLAELDLNRIKKLQSSDAVTEAEYEQALRDVLAQRQRAQSHHSSLNVLPAQRQALTAFLDAKQASLGQAQLDLDHTVLVAPFDCRLSEVSLEKGQFVATSQSLFEAFGVAVAEVEAQMPIDQVRNLLTPGAEPFDISNDPMHTMRTVFNVEAIVRMRTGDFVVEWDGRFDRVREELDLQTRTLRIVIAVDRPYEGVVPGKRPPLAPGMFCEVEVRGTPRQRQIVIPRTSLKNGATFILDNDNRLRRQPVTVAFSQGGFSVIDEGLEPGAKLIVSDPTPAIEGMLVDPTLDPDVAARLQSEAAGEGPMR